MAEPSPLAASRPAGSHTPVNIAFIATPCICAMSDDDGSRPGGSDDEVAVGKHAGFADAMNKLLSRALKDDAAPVLAKRHTAAMKASAAQKSTATAAATQKKSKSQLKKQHMVVGAVESNVVLEKALRRTATRGGVFCTAGCLWLGWRVGAACPDRVSGVALGCRASRGWDAWSPAPPAAVGHRKMCSCALRTAPQGWGLCAVSVRRRC